MTFNGLRILLVEDDSLVAMVTADLLEELGCEVLAIAGHLEEAVDKAKAGGFGCALLDVNLHGEDVFPVAEILAAQGTPFVFASGYGSWGLPETFRGRPVVSKPFRIDMLSAALSAALSGRSGQ